LRQVQSSDSTISLSTIDHFIDSHLSNDYPRYEKYWQYYRNDLEELAKGGGQKRGLPKRYRRKGYDQPEKEIVIENDIAWRIHTLGDFMFGKPVVIQSQAKDPSKRTAINDLLNRVFEANGGISFFQNLSLLGSVYGFVDILLRVNEGVAMSLGGDVAIEDLVRLDLVEAPRVIAMLSPSDYRKIEAYVIHYKAYRNEVSGHDFVGQIKNRILGKRGAGKVQRYDCVTSIYTDSEITEFDCRPLKPGAGDSRLNRLGRIPVVHIQNLPQPFHYGGLSEVEPLIPLQDELNVRLSDRANRVTFQSFKMYLGKGIDGFSSRKVGPGQMWETDNPDAEIIEFGGDQACPSEDKHIEEIRQAMDKASAVTGVAAGVLRGRVGSLSSENALRVTMLGLLAKTERKRVTYGQGITCLCELILHAADVYGVLSTTVEERRVRLDWPSPLPENDEQRLLEAKQKLEIGVSSEQVLREMGYWHTPPGEDDSSNESF